MARGRQPRAPVAAPPTAPAITAETLAPAISEEAHRIREEAHRLAVERLAEEEVQRLTAAAPPPRPAPVPPPTPVPLGEETPRSRFRRLGQARMIRVLNSIRLLGNLAGSGYAYTDRDIDKMEDAVMELLQGVLAQLRRRTRPEVEFEFDPNGNNGSNGEQAP